MTVRALTRAQFLIRAGVAAIAAAAPPALTATRARAATVLGRSYFAPHVGGVFYVATPGGRVSVRLVSIDDVPGAKNAERSFSLVFRGRAGAFTQGTYSVAGGKAGRLQLFLVPVGKTSGLQRYEAVFNRTAG
jgi:hypothetical protein